MTQPFYKPRPVAPEDNRQMVGLRWSLRISVAGWIVYGAFAYAFADVGIIPAGIQSAMVILGSVLIVAGAESNTIATTEAALSKLGTDRISVWDYSAVLASVLGGICTPLITFSTRQPELAGTWWRQVAVRLGPLILGIAGVLDFYGAVTELALAKRDHVRELGQWLDEEQEWNESKGIVTLPPAPKRADPTWRAATFDDVQRLTERLNGDRSTFNRDALLRLLAANELRFDKSRATADRWARVVREG